jgi:hypothetical protein
LQSAEGYYAPISRLPSLFLKTFPPISWQNKEEKKIKFYERGNKRNEEKGKRNKKGGS